MMRWDAILRRIESMRPETPIIGAEVGVWEGENAYNLLKAKPDLALFLIDQWKADDEAYRLSGDGKGGLTQADFDRAYKTTVDRLKDHWNRYSLFKLPSVEAAACFQNLSLDFVFIDANHSYEAVKADILAWMPKVKTGGFIGGHDLRVYAGVQQAVEEMFRNEYIQDSDFTWFYWL